MRSFGSEMPMCPNNCSQWAMKYMDYCLCSVKDGASFSLGMISVIVWVVAEIPQLITHYREKSTEGLSVAFLTTWILGDLFNLFGCILEPATLPTQYYMAVLYTIITFALAAQTVYYSHIYPQLKCNRQLKHSKQEQGETPTKARQSNIGEKQANGTDKNNEYDTFSEGTCPIPLPALPLRIRNEGELYYQSARNLSKSHTPTAGSMLAQRMSPFSPLVLGSVEEPLLVPSVSTKSAPDLKIKTTLCLASTLTFLGVLSLHQSPDTRLDPMVLKPRQEFVIQVGRKLLQTGFGPTSLRLSLVAMQLSGAQMLEHGTAEGSGIGNFLGWAMAVAYMGGRLPQICLNIKRGNVEGLNPLMFLFALIGNATYVASILVSSLEWSKIKPNLPWLVDAGGCVLLDAFILVQFIYFRCHASQAKESKYENQIVV